MSKLFILMRASDDTDGFAPVLRDGLLVATLDEELANNLRTQHAKAEMGARFMLKVIRL